MHLWHDLSAGDNTPEEVNAILEISMKSKVKYELDKETGLLCVDRILSSPSFYPLHQYTLNGTYRHKKCDHSFQLFFA